MALRENLGEVVIGAAVVAVAAGFLLYASKFGVGAGVDGGYRLVANFRSAEGVGPGSDVRLAGVSVGKVTALTLDHETYRARLEMRVAQDIGVPEDSIIVIASEGLLGGSFVEIDPGGSLVMLEPGSEIDNTQGAVSLIGLLTQFVGARDQ